MSKYCYCGNSYEEVVSQKIKVDMMLGYLYAKYYSFIIPEEYLEMWKNKKHTKKGGESDE